MKSNNNYDDVIFMSSGQFAHLTDTESFVFSHVAFFACQMRPYKRRFKQTTRAICNKTGYSPNAVRTALCSLIEKGFLKRGKPMEREEGSYHPYYDNIAHHLEIGDNEYAAIFAKQLEKTLIESRQKKLKASERLITFFKVHVGQLKRSKSVALGNKSKHLHKALILHGYLYNQHTWNLEKGRPKVNKTVPFLAHTLKWSQNTVRRVVNTLQLLDIISYEFIHGVVKFLSVNPFKVVSSPVKTLITKLGALNKQPNPTSSRIHPPEIRAAHRTPREAAEHLNFLKQQGRV